MVWTCIKLKYVYILIKAALRSAPPKKSWNVTVLNAVTGPLSGNMALD